MNPKEKAAWLVLKFMSKVVNMQVAKECALVNVDQIMESREDDGAFDDTKWGNLNEYYTPHPMYKKYWNLVKQEIEKQ